MFADPHRQASACIDHVMVGDGVSLVDEKAASAASLPFAYSAGW
jgi:hypothetical protein